MRHIVSALVLPLIAGACAALVEDYAVQTCGDHGAPDPVCATCEETACANERAACLADPACAPLARCLVSCAADDGACRAGCYAACPETTKTLSALTHCRRAACRDECVPCGGSYDYLAEPDCSACLNEGCCDEMTTCLDHAGCAEVLTCVEACGKTGGPPCVLRCAGIDPSAELDVIGGAQWSCVQQCEPCRPGHHWECVGAHDLLLPEKSAITDRTQLLDFATQVPIPGMTIKACRDTDVFCDDPVDTQVTDDDGRAAHTLPTIASNQLAGFTGFLEVTGPGYMPLLRHFDSPLAFDREARQEVMLALESLTTVKALTGVTAEPGRAHLAVQVEDCVRHWARGVTIDIDPEAGGSRFYLDVFIPRADLTSTVQGGTAVFLNVIPTTVAIRGHVEETGELIGETSALLRPDSLNVIYLRPLRR